MRERRDFYYTQLRHLTGESLDKALCQINSNNRNACASYLDDAVQAVKIVTTRMGREGTMTNLIEHIRDKAAELSKISADILSGAADANRFRISSLIDKIYCDMFDRF